VGRCSPNAAFRPGLGDPLFAGASPGALQINESPSGGQRGPVNALPAPTNRSRTGLVLPVRLVGAPEQGSPDRPRRTRWAGPLARTVLARGATCGLPYGPAQHAGGALAQTPAQVYRGDADCSPVTSGAPTRSSNAPSAALTDAKITWQNRPTTSRSFSSSPTADRPKGRGERGTTPAAHSSRPCRGLLVRSRLPASLTSFGLTTDAFGGSRFALTGSCKRKLSLKRTRTICLWRARRRWARTGRACGPNWAGLSEEVQWARPVRVCVLMRTIRFGWIRSARARVLSTIEPGLGSSRRVSSIIFAAAARRCNSWACTSEWHCGHTKSPGASAHVQFFAIFQLIPACWWTRIQALFFNPANRWRRRCGSVSIERPRNIEFHAGRQPPGNADATKRMIRPMIPWKDPGSSRNGEASPIKNCQSQNGAETIDGFFGSAGVCVWGCWR